MRHAALLISIVLTLMSGIVLSQLWVMAPVNPRSMPAVASPLIEETATAFYEAVNGYLEDGDDAAMQRLLHPEFVTHQPGSAGAGTTEDFVHHLDSVRRLYPGIQLEPEAASLGNNTASVTLSVRDLQVGEFAGVGIDPVEMVGRLDFVRIERGLIIERWSSAPMAGQLDAYPALSIDLPFAINTLVTRVQQIPLESVSDSMISHVRNLLLIVTSGEAFLDVTSESTIAAMLWRVNQGQAAAAAPVEPETTVSLRPLDAVYLPAGTSFRVWDSSNQEARLLALEFGPPMSGEPPSTAPLFEALGGTLWSGIELEGVGDRLTLSFGRATLLPRSTLSSQEVQGMELTWVSDGSLEMSGSGGEARVRKAGGTRSQLIDGHASLVAGEAAAAGPGSDIRYQISGNEPATAWFFSLVPAPASPDDADAAPDGSTPVPTPPRNPTVS